MWTKSRLCLSGIVSIPVIVDSIENEGCTNLAFRTKKSSRSKIPNMYVFSEPLNWFFNMKNDEIIQWKNWIKFFHPSQERRFELNSIVSISFAQLYTVTSVCSSRNYFMSNDLNFKLMSQSFTDDLESKCGIKHKEQQSQVSKVISGSFSSKVTVCFLSHLVQRRSK